MADAIVGILKDYLVQQVKHEAQVLSGLGDRVDLVQDKLERLNAFLKDSQGKRDSEQVRVLIKQIREAAYKIEDVIDNYIVSVIRYERRTFPGNLDHGINHAITLNEVNAEIDRLSNKVTAIYEDNGKFDIKAGDHEKTALTMEQVDSYRSNVEDDEVVGFDKYSEEVTKLLVEGNSFLDVVSIVGMAGLGKSTLARKVYRDPIVCNHFGCCAWQVVGNQYSAKEILLGIFRSVKSVSEDNTGSQISDREASEEQTIVMLKKELQRHLSHMRYLIVLDDVWHEEVWDEIKDAFPNDNVGSRILITSRQEKEASAISSTISNTRPYQLQHLSDHYSWVLFSKKVFRGEECRPSLKALGEKIVKDCKGLPLSIVVIAGILRNKERSEQEWERVVGHVSSYINNEDTLVNKILRLSYDDLPLHLKPCFLYFGIYPEDFEIPMRQLVQLWVAEGFIILKPTDERILEDVAEDYLEELIGRSLIEVECRRTDGGVKTCRIHDLFRELCISESEENQILKVGKDVSKDDGKPTRRLSLHCSPPSYMAESACDFSGTRSLFCFNKDKYEPDFRYMNILSKNLKLLHVLDAGKVDYPFFFIEKLFKFYHLRYFRAISKYSINQIDNSVYSLLYLETLDLRGIRVSRVTEGIWNLKNLRHLYINGKNAPLPNIPGRKTLPNLQTLSIVLLDELAVHQLKNIPKLRKLGVSTLGSKSSNPLNLLRKLQHLSFLTTLKIFYCGSYLITVDGFPPNITKVTLVDGSCCLSDTVKALGSLPKLRYLKISEWNDRNCLTRYIIECVDIGSFPELLVLKMKDVECKYWKVAEGAMPHLQSLVINRCEFSIDLPSAQFQNSLKEVKVLWSSKEMVNRFKNLGLKDKQLTIYSAIGEEKDN